MRRLLNLLFFVQLTAEPDGYFANRMWTPLRPLSFLTEKLPVKHSLFQLFVLVALLAGGRAARARRARPMDRAIWASLAAIVVWWAYGIATGGDVKATFTQCHTFLSSLLFGLALANHNRTPRDFFALGKVIVYAALYRSITIVIYYVAVVRGSGTATPDFMSSHEDTVLFVDALLILGVYALHSPTSASIRALVLGAPLIFVAIQLNNRRIAWASLAGGIIVLYSLLPARTKLAQRVNRYALIAAPLVALYVAVGWGNTSSRVFKPVAALASMGGGKVDASTKARDNENAGLATMVGERTLVGTGWGHEWLELDKTYTVPIEVFPMYHYLCHNNVLLLLAYVGFVGFAATWMVFPVSAYLNARTYRTSRDPIERTAAMVAVCGVVVSINQMWGDIGLICVTPTYLAAAGTAVAARLSVTSGAWPDRGSTRTRRLDPDAASMVT